MLNESLKMSKLRMLFQGPQLVKKKRKLGKVQRFFFFSINLTALRSNCIFYENHLPARLQFKDRTIVLLFHRHDNLTSRRCRYDHFAHAFTIFRTTSFNVIRFYSVALQYSRGSLSVCEHKKAHKLISCQ